ncbi:MAG: hypothetical protein F6K36_03055 [Symploca sp. SIO3C6]|uniref:Uncharacterized protein n=1 Tax=Symploca sp. SIO1C4 TaxID=2607765 RepID=A0A6B3N847_9CYAN|nr:hypothetical protein [Symploca sp. SIO3C6]NER29299.1 hypothetical protein [Symploca sp. SIO1C4]
MIQPLTLSPRYRLDDESPWLEGIDPARNYWIAVNGDATLKVAIPGLFVCSCEQWKQSILKFRSLQAGEQMDLVRISSSLKIYCISSNCYAIEGEIAGATVWHLFDSESLDSLLMSAHPDWQCAPTDIDLGRQMLSRSWEQEAVA